MTKAAARLARRILGPHRADRLAAALIEAGAELFGEAPIDPEAETRMAARWQAEVEAIMEDHRGNCRPRCTR